MNAVPLQDPPRVVRGLSAVVAQYIRDLATSERG
jgi:hypothetical protein